MLLSIQKRPRRDKKPSSRSKKLKKLPRKQESKFLQMKKLNWLKTSKKLLHLKRIQIRPSRLSLIPKKLCTMLLWRNWRRLLLIEPRPNKRKLILRPRLPSNRRSTWLFSKRWLKSKTKRLKQRSLQKKKLKKLKINWMQSHWQLLRRKKSTTISKSILTSEWQLIQKKTL